MQPLIAITASEVINNGESWLPIVYGQFHTYPDAVIRAGGAPFIVPLTDDEAVLRKLYDQCGGLLLSGGADLDPKTYNAARSPKQPKASTHPLQTKISPRRDRQEVIMLKWALEDDKPVLGICRGMQLINAVLGGSLHQDIDDDVPTAHNHQISIDQRDFHHLAHRLEIDVGSRLHRILGVDSLATNTLHHQAIGRLGDGLVATAHAEDGVIEAIELPAASFVIGVQSHPEALEAGVESVWRELFKTFVSSAADYLRTRR